MDISVMSCLLYVAMAPDTVTAYGGSAPSWVYVETAVFLTHLLGLQGYLQMVCGLK